MKLTKEQVDHLAHLARLFLTEEEKAKYAGQLTDILTYVDILSEVDTEGVPETSQVTGLSNVLREDGIDLSICNPDELLEVSPLPKKDHQIRIKRMM
jgi:aspartyl-tRNA(Asn)/glutamyl-tRNA(Gln) amidotransferase subunit C